jgi:pyruvate formate lyase activating enzyme
MKKAILFEKLPNKLVQCLACSWYCKITKGRTGVCGVRQNINGDLYLLVYGRPTGGLALDPVEKKPLYHFLPCTETLSFGTYGCNFGCTFCLNWQYSQLPRLMKEKITDKENAILELKKNIEDQPHWLPERIVNYAVKNHIPSISYTYNEPAVFFEYAYETAKLAHQKGIKNIFVSNGYESKEAFELIRAYLDAANIDIKSFSEQFYLRICKAKLKPVLETIERMVKEGIWVEITTTLITDLNDNEKELSEMANFLKKLDPAIPWHLNTFRPDYKMLDRPATDYTILEKAYAIGKEAGLLYVYAYSTEVADEKDSTFCPKCGELLIERHWCQTITKNFKRGKCGKCGEKIKGVWGK